MGLCTPMQIFHLKNLPFPAIIVIYNINNVYTVFLINVMLFLSSLEHTYTTQAQSEQTLNPSQQFPCVYSSLSDGAPEIQITQQIRVFIDMPAHHATLSGPAHCSLSLFLSCLWTKVAHSIFFILVCSLCVFTYQSLSIFPTLSPSLLQEQCDMVLCCAFPSTLAAAECPAWHILPASMAWHVP